MSEVVSNTSRMIKQSLNRITEFLNNSQSGLDSFENKDTDSSLRSNISEEVYSEIEEKEVDFLDGLSYSVDEEEPLNSNFDCEIDAEKENEDSSIMENEDANTDLFMPPVKSKVSKKTSSEDLNLRLDPIPMSHSLNLFGSPNLEADEIGNSDMIETRNSNRVKNYKTMFDVDKEKESSKGIPKPKKQIPKNKDKNVDFKKIPKKKKKDKTVIERKKETRNRNLRSSARRKEKLSKTNISDQKSSKKKNEDLDPVTPEKQILSRKIEEISPIISLGTFKSRNFSLDEREIKPKKPLRKRLKNLFNTSSEEEDKEENKKVQDQKQRNARKQTKPENHKKAKMITKDRKEKGSHNPNTNLRLRPLRKRIRPYNWWEGERNQIEVSPESLSEKQLRPKSFKTLKSKLLEMKSGRNKKSALNKTGKIKTKPAINKIKVLRRRDRARSKRKEEEIVDKLRVDEEVNGMDSNEEGEINQMVEGEISNEEEVEVERETGNISQKEENERKGNKERKKSTIKLRIKPKLKSKPNSKPKRKKKRFITFESAVRAKREKMKNRSVAKPKLNALKKKVKRNKTALEEARIDRRSVKQRIPQPRPGKKENKKRIQKSDEKNSEDNEISIHSEKNSSPHSDMEEGGAPDSLAVNKNSDNNSRETFKKVQVKIRREDGGHNLKNASIIKSISEVNLKKTIAEKSKTPIFAGIAFSGEQFRFGFLFLPPKTKKDLEKPTCHKVFFIHKASEQGLKLTVNSSVSLLSEGMSFMIPRDNLFCIENVSRSVANICFWTLKN